MAFTGEAVRQGTTDRYGVGDPGGIPRAFASLNGEPYVITRDALVHITDLANGSGVLIQNNSEYNLVGSDPACAFVYNDRLYFLDRNDDILASFDDPLTGDVSFVAYYTGITSPNAAASDGTTVWIYDTTFDTLYTMDPATAATVSLGPVGFDVTTPSNNINGMFHYDGSLYLLDNGTELLFVIDDPSAATLEATVVDVAIVEFGVGQVGVNGGGVHDGEAYMAGGNPDALYRFYNVRWNETIAAIEVDEGGNDSLDLSTVSKDATSFVFVPGYTAPSWLTISGNDLVITNAPDVTADTDFEPQVRAVRGGKHEETTLTVRVRDASVQPPMVTVPGAPTSLSLTATHNRIVATWAAAANNGGEAPSRYDVRINNGQWIDTGLDLRHTFENLSAETEYTIDVAQVNSAGRGAVASASVTTDAAPVVITTPGAPRSLALTETHNSIVARWAAAANNGGEAPSRYDVRIDGGGWIDTGLDLTHTFENLSPTTQYTIDVAQVNSAGRGNPATERVTTDAEPVVITTPGAPRSLSLTETHNSIVATWRAAANNGGEAPSRYDVRIDGGQWIDTGLDLRHTFENLSPTTQYLIEVAEVNAAGRGTTASKSVRTDAAPVVITAPLAPQNLTVDLTATTAILRWAISGTGSPADTYEVSYAEGGTLGSDWIDTESLRTRFFIRRLKRGTRYTFAVRGRNSEGAGAASRAVTERTPIALLHNALFFRECVNYFDEGARVSEYGNPSNIIRAVGDNDYRTYTREKDLVLNITVNGAPTRVDAVFVKGIGIEGHSAEPTGGSGAGYSNRMMPETIQNWEGTEVPTTVAGFQHDLYLLDGHFTATSVRMTFTGADAKITEILLLEFGMEIDANSDFTQIDPYSVDRSGKIDEGPGGRLRYRPPIGQERDKWEVDYTVRVVPGKTILETPEEFLYWRADNRNHVFCMEPSRFPWRIFPAVFVGKSVPIRYRTDSKTSGEILSFRVAEQ